MALVDNRRSRLEALPDFLAQLLADRTNLTVFLMQLLQLVEGADDILFVGQLLGSLAEFGLQLQILLEVIFTSLAIQLQQVIELLDIQLIVAPQFVSLVSGDVLNLTPLVLQGLEVLIRLVSLLGRGHHRLDFLDDGQLLLQVVLFLLLLLTEQLLTLLTNDNHLSLESLLNLVRGNLILFRIATAIDIGFKLCFTLGNMQLIEASLQIVHFVLLGSLVAMSQLTYALKHFLLGLILFTFRLGLGLDN